ncbi:MAG: alpha/beta hydrolase [Thermodesulfobacteriota bacterium]
MTFLQVQKSGQHQKTLVFLPGWGFNGQVARYGSWPEEVNLLVPAQFCHGGMVAELREYLARAQVAQVALVGWSMGAHLAWDFASSYPDLVSSVSLLAGRSHWPSAEIAAIKKDLAAGVNKSMQGFYRKCFLGYKDLYRQFAGELEADYLAGLRQGDLVAGLDYLADHPLCGSAPAGISVQILHGRKDVVAPVAERPQIEGAREEVIDATGHLIFAQPHSYLL